MSRLETIARGLVHPMNPYATSILGLLTLLWGIWIANPFWDVFGTSQLWWRAGSLAPEWAWGTWATLCGLFIWYELFRGKYVWLVHFLGFATWHWWTVAGMLWWGDWQNTGGLTYTFIAIWTTYAYLNIKVNFVKNGINSHF